MPRVKKSGVLATRQNKCCVAALLRCCVAALLRCCVAALLRCCVAALLIQCNGAFADDTEMFFSHGTGGVKPTIFFILDDSASMQEELQKRPRKTREQVLKETLNKLLDKMQGVRFGMMSMNDEKRSKVALEVGDIDEVRAEAQRQIDDEFKADARSTPIAESLYAATLYLNAFKKNDSFPDKSIGFPGRDSRLALKGDFASPISQACQPTHLVLLTDGEANREYSHRIKHLTGDKTCVSRSRSRKDRRRENAEDCVPELAHWLHKNNQSPYRNTTVTTHTVAFALGSNTKAKELLKDIADAGGGGAYTADNAEQLFSAFSDIVENAAADVSNATFVNPGAGGGSSQKSSHSVYYSLFLPKEQDRWPGNLKRYELGRTEKIIGGKKIMVDSIVDVNGNEVFDENGEFNPKAKSVWSSAPDGAEVEQGGAAWKLPNHKKRRLYYSEDNALQRFDLLDMPKALSKTVGSSEWFDHFHYIHGAADDLLSSRHALGDFIHSKPVMLDYADERMLIVGSNEGFAHLFSRVTGEEEFVFMPEALLGNIKTLYENKTSKVNQPHPYGMDNTITPWIDDKNNNGIADAGEDVYAYASMRRGGRNLYALNISNRKNPKLAWQIIGGKDKGLERLGQTWSQPVKSKIRHNGKVTDVLIFGGGYDAAEDNFNSKKDGYAKNLTMGNDIYIVHAKSGQLLWSASTSKLNFDGRMNYSIPGKISVMVNKEGLLEQFFAADTGGQIWRFSVSEKNGHFSVGLGAQNGLFASLGGSGAANARRFYHEPKIVIEQQKLSVHIGSGYHAHPLNTHIEDRFYSLHAAREANANTPTLREMHLADITDKLVASEAQEDIAQKQGWYIRLTRQGEKIMSSSLTVHGELFFNTYVPSISAIACQVTMGNNFSYHLFAKNGSPAGADVLNQGKYPAVRSQQVNINGYVDTPTAVNDKNSNDTIVINGHLLYRVKGNSFCTNPKGCKTFWMDLSPDVPMTSAVP